MINIMLLDSRTSNISIVKSMPFREPIVGIPTRVCKTDSIFIMKITFCTKRDSMHVSLSTTTCSLLSHTILEIAISTPMIWRKPTSHEECYFRSFNLFGFNSKNTGFSI